MRKSNKLLIPVENLTVTKYANEGKGIAYWNDKIIFIEDAIPGDIVDIAIYKNKKNYAEAKLIRIHTPSPDRVTPYCSHEKYCGACRLQHVSVEAQLRLKQQIVKDAFTHIGKINELPEIPLPLSHPNTKYYRNKLEFTFSNQRYRIEGDENVSDNALGFHAGWSFSRVLDITTCYHQQDTSNDIRNFIREYAYKNHLSFYDLKHHNGLLRNIIIRNTSLNEWMLIIVFASHQHQVIQDAMHAVYAKFPFIHSLQYIINTKRNDTIYDQDVICYKGKSYILEQLNNIKYQITAKSFFQINIFQTPTLYNTIAELAQLQKEDIVYDLYCGTGGISLYLASQCKKIIGLELLPESIEQAYQNASLNQISNAHFFAGDMKEIFNTQFYHNNGHPDCIIIDPPRAGLHPKVVGQLLEIKAQRIVYVSCNPITQARDIQIMHEWYEISKIQPVDMFPNTLHLENVILLVRRR